MQQKNREQHSFFIRTFDKKEAPALKVFGQIIKINIVADC